KSVTIPRMELIAATMASPMDVIWKKELHLQLQDSVFLDRQCFCSQIRQKRDFTIHNFCSQSGDRNSQSNPADVASRGSTAKVFLKNRTWTSGPAFLLRSESEWPANLIDLEKLEVDDPEVKKGCQQMADLPSDRVTPNEPPFTRVGVDYFGPFEVKFRKEDVYARKRWRQAQYMSDLFWKRWVLEYLPQLQERQKWSRVKRNFKPGDIVLIVDNTAPRNSWLIGRIIQTFPDRRGLVRHVQVKTKTNCLERPITKVCLLQESEDG
ncbi:uncharacterized protein LOC109200008, partial [Tachysurus ichikawai]